MEFDEFVFGRLMGKWRMRWDVLSIVLLTRSLSHHRPYAQGGQPLRRRYCGKSKHDRHGGREDGKLVDFTLTVARYNAPALRPPIALLISSEHSYSWSMTTFAVESAGNQCGSAVVDPALYVAGGRLGMGGAVARSQNVSVESQCVALSVQFQKGKRLANSSCALATNERGSNRKG